jgi:hypothetical protein
VIKKGGIMKNRIITIVIILYISLASTVYAKIDWEVINRFKAGMPTLDISTSFDGKYVFVLSPGKVQVFSNKGKLEDSLQVDQTMTNISVVGFDKAGIGNKIVLSSRQTGEIQQITYNFIVSIDTQGSPFSGLAKAPVSLVVFSDFQ